MEESQSVGVHWIADKAWSALTTENQPKDCQMREDEETTTAVATTSLPIIQTDFSHSVFTQSVRMFPKFCVQLSTREGAINEDEAVGDDGKESHKKYRLPLICKRQDKIYINLPSIAQEAIHLKSRYAKGEHLKMCPNPACKSCNPLKKVNGVIAKVRKALKPKRIILLQQVLKSQGALNRQTRSSRSAKYEAFSRAVDAIGIGALMITNPETDTDYTKRMFELSVYDKNCQRAESASSSDSQRPDLIIDRLTRLKLEKKDDEETVSTPATVSQGWRSWHEATSSKIFSERSDEQLPNCSRNFSE